MSVNQSFILCAIPFGHGLVYNEVASVTSGMVGERHMASGWVMRQKQEKHIRW